MNAEFDPIQALILIAWFVAAGFAVRPFLREPKATGRNVSLFVLGFVMLAMGVSGVVILIRIFLL